MIRVAIVDDVISVCGHMEKYLFDIAKKYNLSIDVESYNSGESFCSDLKMGEVFDIIFLDIELKSMSGIDVCRYIRQEMDDETQQIVFISAKKQYSLELHSFHPLDFLVKEIDEISIETVFMRFMKITGIWNDVFEFQIGHDVQKIKVKEIKYLTVENRIVNIILKNNQASEYYGTLETAYKQLKKFDFLFLHRRFIVNPMYIGIYEYDKVILNDGIEIPIGSSKRQQIRAWQIRNSDRRK